MTHTLAMPGDATTHVATQTAPMPSSGGGVTIAPKLNAPLTACVTIDATRPDGYLSNAKTGTPISADNTSVQTAAGGLSQCLGGKQPLAPASIVGHGADGVIVTGAGKSLGAKDQHIGLDNADVWSKAFQPLKGKMANLLLYGCHVGAGLKGAQLLHDLATTVGANVYAPTGLIYCDSHGDFSLEIGSEWQMASPTQPVPPPPIEEPKPATDPQSGGLVRLHVLENILITTLDQLSHVFLEGYPQAAGALDLVETLAREVLWHKPFTPPGQHAALFTGRLHLHFGHGERTIEKVFSVFNHALLQDEDHPGVFYRTSGKWRDHFA